MLGIAIGVALLFASQVANTSLDGSVQRLTDGIVGRMRFQLAARDSAGFDERLLSRVQRLPGVAGAAPILDRISRELHSVCRPCIVYKGSPSSRQSSHR